MKLSVFNPPRGQRIVACGLLAMASLVANASLAADVHLGVNIAAGQRLPLSAIDHSAWDTLLKRHVDERGMVDSVRESLASANPERCRFKPDGKTALPAF